MATRAPKTFQATASLGRNQERSLNACLQPGATFNLWEGSIRAGKTYVSVLAFLIAIANLDDESATGGQLVVIGKNLGSIYRNFFRTIEDSPGLRAFRGAVSYRQNAPTAHIFGREVQVIGVNDGRAESKIRGMTILYVYVDEATVIDETAFKQTLNRMSLDESKLFATTNPDSPAHWLKRRLHRPDATPPRLASLPLHDGRQPVPVRRGEAPPAVAVRGPLVPSDDPRRLGVGRRRDLRHVGPRTPCPPVGAAPADAAPVRRRRRLRHEQPIDGAPPRPVEGAAPRRWLRLPPVARRRVASRHPRTGDVAAIPVAAGGPVRPLARPAAHAVRHRPPPRVRDRRPRSAAFPTRAEPDRHPHRRRAQQRVLRHRHAGIPAVRGPPRRVRQLPRLHRRGAGLLVGREGREERQGRAGEGQRPLAGRRPVRHRHDREHVAADARLADGASTGRLTCVSDGG
ncbi:hypothetical protein IFU40_13610 [Microbacterium sp. CFBP 13617]|nr:hypothetical protein [Microbacterium sp. CFBP 13617]